MTDMGRIIETKAFNELRRERRKSAGALALETRPILERQRKGVGR